MQIKFTCDFRGVLTGERFYRAGETGEFSAPIAHELVTRGVAERLAEVTEVTLSEIEVVQDVEPEAVVPGKANHATKNKTTKRNH